MPVIAALASCASTRRAEVGFPRHRCERARKIGRTTFNRKPEIVDMRCE
jgi:hypothetical protein